MYRTQQDCNTIIDRLQSGAEKELAAFALAVQELFGPDAVSQSIEDWLNQMESMDWPVKGAISDWRRVTIATVVRLAGRFNLQTSILQRLTA